MYAYGTKVDCEYLKVILRDTREENYVFMGNERKNHVPYLLRKKVGCYVKDVLGIGVMPLTLKKRKKGKKKAEDVPVVCEFRDVFPEELQRLPP